MYGPPTDSSTTVQIIFEGYLHAVAFLNIGILPNVNFTKLNRDVKQEKSVCSRIIRLTNDQVKTKGRLLFLQKKRKRRQRCCGNYENCTTVGCCLARLGAITTSKRREVQEKPEANIFEINSTSTIHTVYAPSSNHPRKWRNIAWKNTGQKVLISEVPTLWNFRTDLKKRLKDNSDAPEARRGMLPKKVTSSKKRRKLHFTRPRKSGYCRYINKGAVGNRKDHKKKSDDGDDGQWRGANKRSSHGKCQRIGLIRDGDASWRNTRNSLSLSRSSARIMGILTTGPAVKYHISPKKARHLIAIFQTMYHS